MKLDFSKLDVKKFLSLPVNDGRKYWDSAAGCGCIKGNIGICLGMHPDSDLLSVAMYSMQNQTKAFSAFLPEGWISSKNGPNRIGKEDPRLANILDRAEEILILKKKPQFAKLFLIRALRKYGYVPKEENVATRQEEFNLSVEKQLDTMLLETARTLT